MNDDTNKMPIWLSREIKQFENLLKSKDERDIIGMTTGATHENQRHLNIPISTLIDRCLSNMDEETSLGKRKPKPAPATSFFGSESMDDAIISAIEANTESITEWVNHYGNHKDKNVLGISSDDMMEDLGYGIRWSDDNKRLQYTKSKRAVIVLERCGKDRSKCNFIRKTSYIDLSKEACEDKLVTTDDSFDLLPYMLQTKHYKNATDKERERLESLVVQSDDKTARQEKTTSKRQSDRKIDKSSYPSFMQDDYNDRQNDDNIPSF